MAGHSFRAPKHKWPLYVGVAVSLTGATLLSPLREPIFKAVGLKEPTNNEQVLTTARGDKTLSALLKKGNRGLAEFISSALQKQEHVNPDYYPTYAKEHGITIMNTPSPDELESLSKAQLVKIYYLLQALSDPEFRKIIGDELNKDMADKSGEHGGILHLVNLNGKLQVAVEMVPNNNGPNPFEALALDGITVGDMSSEDLLKATDNSREPDNEYNPEKRLFSLDMLCPVHFHAQKITLDGAALSGEDFENIDITSQGSQYVLREPASFSTVGGNKFNVDMGLVVLGENGKTSKAINLDLGVYPY